MLLTDPLHWRDIEAYTATYYVPDHCLCACVCVHVRCTHIHTQTDALRCSGIQHDLSLPQISFPLFIQLFMWCVAWLEDYSSAGWIQFSSLVQLYKSSKTPSSPLSVWNATPWIIYNTSWQSLSLPDDDRRTWGCCCYYPMWRLMSDVLIHIHSPVSDLLDVWLRKR